MSDDTPRELDDPRLYQALFESMPQLGWTAQADGYIDYYNQGWFDYTGTTLEQMEGWGWQSVHDPELVDGITELWQASIATGQDFELEFPLRRHDGVFRWFLTRARPLRDGEGNVVRWVGINTDVDDIRAARALGLEMTEQSKDVERALTEIQHARAAAEERVSELEAEVAQLRQAEPEPRD